MSREDGENESKVGSELGEPGWNSRVGWTMVLWAAVVLTVGIVVTIVADSSYRLGDGSVTYFLIMLAHCGIVLPARWLLTRRRPGRDAVLDLLLILVVMTALVEGYTAIKVHVPLVNEMVWDAEMATIDRVLGLSMDPNVFLLTIFGGAHPLIARFFDVYYFSFVGLFVVFAAWFLTDPERKWRLAFSNGWALMWGGGALMYLVFPVRGPVYFTRGLYEEISQVFPVAAHLQAALWSNYAALVAGQTTEIINEFGVAAMPSLHVATHAYLWLWSRRVGSKLAPAFLAMTMLTWLGSVATGWHYAVDGLVGLVLAWGCVRWGLMLVSAASRKSDTG